MKVIEYLKYKYQTSPFLSLAHGEARILGIAWPLKPGWITRHGNMELNRAHITELTTFCIRKRDEINKRGNPDKLARSVHYDYAIEALMAAANEHALPPAQFREPPLVLEHEAVSRYPL